MAGTQSFPQRFGRYSLLKLRSSSDAGDSFVATTEGRDGQSPSSCLVTRLRVDGVTEESRRRFRDTTRAWARLDHPNIVRLLQSDELEGQPFIATELVDGPDLGAVWRRCFEREVPFPIEGAVHIARELAAALVYVHSSADPPLIHKDVCPANIMVSFRGEVKLTGFGLMPTTTPNPVSGSTIAPAQGSYVSPEQAEGRRLDVRTDIYSVGIVFWELLAGQQLFPLSDGPRWDRATIRRPSKCDPSVPTELERIAMKALEPTRSKRQQSAAELRAELDAVLPVRSGATALRVFLAELFAGDPEGPPVVAATGAPPDAEASPENIPEARPTERTVPTSVVRRLLSRVSARPARYAFVIAVLMVAEIVGAAVFFHSGPLARREAIKHLAVVPAGDAPVGQPPPGSIAAAPAPVAAPAMETAPATAPALAAAAEEPSPSRELEPKPEAQPAARTPNGGRPLGKPRAAQPPAPAPAPSRTVVTAPRPAPLKQAGRPVATGPRAPLPGLVPAVATAAGARNQTPSSNQPIPPGQVAVAPNQAPDDPATPEPGSSNATSAEALTAEAEEAFRAGRQLDAVRLARKSLAAGASARARMVLAESYFDLKLFREARDAYSDVLAQDPGNQAARVGRDLAERELTQAQPQPIDR